MKKLIFLFVFISVQSLGLIAQTTNVIEILRNSEDKVFSRTETEKSIQFYISGINQSQIAVLEQQSLTVEGVKSLSISNNEENGKFLATAVFVKEFSGAGFQKLLLTMNVSKVVIGEREIETSKISEVLQKDAEYRKGLREIDKRIEDIQKKIDWANNDPDEKKIAEENGWFTKAYETLEKAKLEREQYISNNSK
ncbi:MAG: hypothetical protein A2W91_02040 [Bacteroidetes bacterium GWF2_38_335]|nr:MAG: hypothetical protein A2W91_02040 [Bacteroidetes bacterium GWF2_38_335]OFY80633.1 MAG: hypothetical protein A2281_05055 [Bacteroidetes bacterium RIFOXYA12_FULL_38_20]HBS86974.1 hypothetical protein [Bacteroidales bacterium]